MKQFLGGPPRSTAIISPRTIGKVLISYYFGSPPRRPVHTRLQHGSERLCNLSLSRERRPHLTRSLQEVHQLVIRSWAMYCGKG